MHSSLGKYGLEKDSYFFSMCSLEPNKNFKWIAETAKENPDRIFAVAGSINKDVFADGLGFECPENMRLLGYVSDEEAKTLMRDCSAFLFPTFYEGFGIPPLEALSAGAKNVVVSDTEDMHEVFGDAVSYVDPNQVCSTFAERAAKNKKMKGTLSRYSWYTSARLMRDMFNQMYN